MSIPPSAKTTERRKLLSRLIVLDRARTDMLDLWRTGDGGALEEAERLAQRMDSLSEQLAEAWSAERERRRKAQ